MPALNLLKAFRVAHLYVGVFIAPAVLFFAFSGALQTFGLHETNREHPTYTPAKWEVVLAQIHKKQTSAIPNRRPPAAAKPSEPSSPTVSTAPAETEHARRGKLDGSPEHQASTNRDAPATAPALAATAAKPASPGPDQASRHNPMPLRIFFLIVSIGLFVSTLTGIYMSYKYNRNKVFVTLTLIAGTVVPPLLLLV